MQVNVAGLRRNIKNLAHNYSEAQVKVREATSNDPWGPSAAIMAEIADLTYNVVAFSEIMQMIWKRLNDHGKNWRHVYKALILLEYLIKTGTEKVAQQCKENIFAIQTLREFIYYEEGKDQGTHVREKAKQLVNLLKDDERLKNERIKALKAKERFAQHPSGFGSDGYIDGPSQRDMPPGWQEEPKPLSELELVRPQTAGEEELQLKLAMAMSREEAEQEEAKRRSDDVRLQLALSQSEQDFKDQQTTTRHAPPRREEPQSHLLDLLDISLGAASISSPPLGAAGGMGGPDPWATPARAASQLSDPWSGTSSPQIDPWQPAAGMRSNTASAPLGAVGGIASVGTNGDAWALRTQSPSVASGSSTEGWLQSNGAAVNGNSNVVGGDPWLGKSAMSTLAAAQPPTTLGGNNASGGDPWLSENPKPTAVPPASAAPLVDKSLSLDDPWAPKTLTSADDPWKSLENAGIKKPSPDMDEFDIITNRNKTGDLLSDDLLSGPNNNNNATENLATNGKKPLKTPQAFLGENSSLVNLDNLIKPVVPQTQSGNAAYNPFSDTVISPKTNLFQQQQPAVPSINQLKQQQPFAMSINQDPWAPVTNNPNVATQQVKENPFLHEFDGLMSAACTSSRSRTFNLFDTEISNDHSTSQYQGHVYARCYDKNNNNNNNNNNDNNSNNNKNMKRRSDGGADDVFNTSYIPQHFLSNYEDNKNTNNNSNINYNDNNKDDDDDDNLDIELNRDFDQLRRQIASNDVRDSTIDSPSVDVYNIAHYQLLENGFDSLNQRESINNYNYLHNNNNNNDSIYAYTTTTSASSAIGFERIGSNVVAQQRNETVGNNYNSSTISSAKRPCNIASLEANNTLTARRGGSLFDYGFYGVNRMPNDNFNMLPNVSHENGNNNNNNNNMGWIKPDTASSNPFLS